MTYALEISHLCKSFGGVKVTQDVSFAVQPGERRLIIGPNGAGKTTLFNQNSGELQPDSGSIKVFGEDVTHQPVLRRAHAGVSRTYQIITLFPKDSLLHNVALSLLGVSPRRFQAFSPLTLDDTLYQQAETILDSVGLKDSAHLAASEISYGEQRRVEIAVAMAQSPRLLLLDEVMAGLIPTEVSEMTEVIRTIRDSGVEVLLIEHLMQAVMSLSDHIYVLNNGRMIANGTPQEITANPQVIEAYLGHGAADA